MWLRRDSRFAHDYFGKFGALTDVVVMAAGVGKARHSRGFGFVTFAAPDSVELVCQERYHQIGDRAVEVKRALSRETMQQQAEAAEYAEKIIKDADTIADDLAGLHLQKTPAIIPATAGIPVANSTFAASAYTDCSACMYPAGYPGGWVAAPTPYGVMPGHPPYLVPAGVPAGVPIFVPAPAYMGVDVNSPPPSPAYVMPAPPGMAVPMQAAGMQTMAAGIM